MNKNLPDTIRIGTRGSPLALTQSRLVVEKLAALFSRDSDSFEIVPIKSSGDYEPRSGPDERLADSGGKGLFTKEIEGALLAEHVDIAVHSVKDMPTWLPKGLILAATLPREDPRDALVALQPDATLETLPQGAVIGTSSPRRQAQLLHIRPDFHVIPFRGNVDTRLRKIIEGKAQATLLAYAGLKRLGIEKHASCVLDTHLMLPAVGQGAIGIEIREKDEALRELLAASLCANTFAAIMAERAMLAVLDGSCHTPIGGFGVVEGGTLTLKGLVADMEGKGLWCAEEKASVNDSAALGKEVGQKLRACVPAGILPG
jgi:hydroxymethylbilane synthase